jgi:hypothetical protein
VIAIDPGTNESAFCQIVKSEAGSTLLFGARMYSNEELLEVLPFVKDHKLAIEMIASYGLPVGVEVFQTVLWTGRFIQAHGGEYHLVYRKDVKLHICGSLKAKDSNIRQAMIDRFGSPGTKKAPGRLYKFNHHMISALAVGLTVIDLASSMKKKGE